MRLKQEIINGIFAIKDLSNSLESFNTFNPFNLIIYKVNEIITEERTKPVSSIEFIESKYSNDNAKKDLVKLFNNSRFDYPKPIELIKTLIKIYNNKNAIILDFFAGSGTTGQAVVELNSEDNGNRQFILCTNNENNICEEVTYQRLIKVNYGNTKAKPLKFNLKHYRTSYIPRINTEEENIQENLLVNIRNLIQLENGISIDDKRTRVILSEDEIDKFSENTEQIKECEKLYISSDILLTAKQVKIFKDNNIEVFIIPEYYFDEEIKGVQ